MWKKVTSVRGLAHAAARERRSHGDDDPSSGDCGHYPARKLIRRQGRHDCKPQLAMNVMMHTVLCTLQTQRVSVSVSKCKNY